MPSRVSAKAMGGRTLFAFAILLVVSIVAATVVAAQAADAGDLPGPDPVPTLPEEDAAEQERRERERAEWLESPAAIEQREISETAYEDLSANEARALVGDAFAEEVEMLDANAGRLVSDLNVEKLLGNFGVLVHTPGGESAIVESSTPLASTAGGEGKEPVDLELERSGNAFVPANPVTEVRLPGNAAGGIHLVDEEVVIEMPAADAVGAIAMGDKSLFYPETLTATDTLVAPIAAGVEVFEQLRSVESPEQFRYALTLPAGAELRSNGSDGAEVVSGEGERIAEVRRPWAVDEQGTEVPVTLSIDGNAIVLAIPHRSQDVAYPILLDPTYVTEFPVFSAWYPNNPWGSYALSQSSVPGQPQLLSAISPGSGASFGAGTWAQWEYTPPGSTAYAERAIFESVEYEPHSTKKPCESTQPHGYAGMYNVSSGWQPGGGSPGLIWSGGWSWTPAVDTGSIGGVGTRKVIVAMGSNTNVTMQCAHELKMGGVTVVQRDPESPSVSVTGVPSGWIGPGYGTVTVTASDPGFGISRISLYNGGVTTTNAMGGCSGTVSNRCLNSPSGWAVKPPYKDGIRKLEVTAEDPVEHVGEWNKQVKVDLVSPAVNLQGELAEATKTTGKLQVPQDRGTGDTDELRFPVYALKVSATDGKSGTPSEENSGVKKLEVELDGENVLEEALTNSEPCDNCGLSDNEITVDLTGLSTDETHVVEAFAEDFVGNKETRKIEFEYIPATGMKEEYVLQRFPLDDGVEREGRDAEHGPELSVNVMNGNLIYHQRDVKVDGPNVDLEVERFYNSQLPEDENTEWGDGWTLAQTPTIDVEAAEEPEADDSARLVEPTGAVLGSVNLPGEASEDRFVPRLGAVANAEEGAPPSLTEVESGATTVFDSAGRTTELETAGPAAIDYAYEGGELSEIAVEDPTSSSEAPQPPPDVAGSSRPQFVDDFSGSGTDPGELYRPTDAAVDAEGGLWVVDQGNNRLQRFDSEGEFDDGFGTKGTGNGQLRRPAAVAIDADGDLWVADAGNRRVQEFEADGDYIRKFGTAGDGNGQFGGGGPEGIAIAADGSVWVADTYNGRLQHFSDEGAFLGFSDPLPAGQGRLLEPVGLDIAPDGSIWTADSRRDRLVKFDDAGEFVSAVGGSGAGEGRFSAPTDVDVDGRGRVLVVDQGNSRVQVLDGEGQFLTSFGAAGSGDGQFRYPAAVASDAGDIWVLDSAARAPRRARKSAPAAPPARGPVAAYSFDEGEGATAHDLTGTHDGTIEGASWVDKGRFGKALSFDGAEDCLTVADAPDLRLAEDFTIETWVRSRGTGTWEPILSKNGGYSIWLGEEAGHPRGYIVEDDEDEALVIDPNGIPENVWSHLALTFDGAQMRLYVNGELADQDWSSGVTSTSSPLSIGCSEEPHEGHFEGLIDEVRVYDRALDAGEVGADKATPIETPPAGPVAAYSFDEGEGATAHDLAGNHDGTIEGASWAKGKFGKGLEFDAESEDLVSVTGTADLQLEEFTLEAWVRPTDTTVLAPAIAKLDEEDWGYALYAGGDGAAGHPEGYILEGKQIDSFVVDDEALTESAWTHVAVTNDGAEMRLYVNGELEGVAAASDVKTGGEGPLTIGGNEAYEVGEYFSGTIDEVRVYDRALDAGEVGADKATPIETPRAEPVAAYSFDEGEGATAHDLTGTHDGTIEGASWTGGRYGGALDFDAEAGDVVTIPDSAELRLGEFTLEAWVRADRHELLEPLIAKLDEEDWGYGLYAGGDAAAGRSQGYLLEGKQISATALAPEALPIGDWTHLATTYDGANIRIYVDGELVDTSSSVGFVADGKGPLQIGGNESYLEPEYFDGSIDEVRVYDRALDAGEVGADRTTPLQAPPTGPVAAYSFDEGEGATGHDVAGEHDGTREGASWSGGKFGKALAFDGEDDCFSVPHSADLELGESFSLEAWVNPDYEEQWAPIIFKEAEGFYSYTLFHGAFNTSRVQGFVADVPWEWSEVEAPDPLMANAWTHVALTSNRTTLRLYIDGEEVASGPSRDAMASEDPLWIGCSGMWEEKFAGKIDEVRIYDRTLNAAEVAADREAPIETPEADPVAAYSFDEGEGATAHDLTGEHDGAVSGATWVNGGRFGKALSFDGVNDCVTVPNSPELQLTGEMTLETWIKGRGTGIWEPIVYKNGAYSIWLGEEAGHSRGYIVEEDEDEALVIDPNGSPENVWSHVVLTFDGGWMRLYVDGELADQDWSSGAAATSSPLTIGCSSVPHEGHFEGLIDEVRVYDRALSSAEIGEEHTAPGQVGGANRIQKWSDPSYDPEYRSALSGSFGTSGTPADVYAAPYGELWVADSANDRIQMFNSSGVLVSEFGESGWDEYQLDEPSAVVVGGGNIWVADAGNDSVKVFDEEGELLYMAGPGSGPGEFSEPSGLAIAPDGNIWVADTGNDRVQVLTPWASSLDVVGGPGSEPGQFDEPQDLSFDADGNLWVADTGNDRIQKLDTEGEVIATFGVQGSDDGELEEPAAVAVDETGIVWVGDSGNNRVQAFDEEGNYLEQLGTGAEEETFDLAAAMGMSIGPDGSIWVTDTDNGQIRKIVPPVVGGEEEAMEIIGAPNDPVVEVETSGDLVSGLEGADAGEHSYDHSGNDLVAYDGPEGETRYEYESGLLTEVELPNGTLAEIEYESETNRVKKVSVDQAGAEPKQSTSFSYSAEPHETTVTFPSSPAIHYKFAADGSLLKSWNSAEPPKLTLSGTLEAERETAEPIVQGLHNLKVEAKGSEPIDRIQIIAHGNTLVSEKVCTIEPEVDCMEDSDEWVVETGELPPGVMQIEVVAIDTIEGAASERFWVNVPYTPPPPADAPKLPTFSAIKAFRAAFGLDLDLNLATEEERYNDRIFALINAWNHPNSPEGQVARMSAEEWGVPLRAVDVAELEYREWYVDINGPLIEQWGTEHHPGTFVSYEVDHAAGGIIRVGFTEQQGSRVAEMLNTLSLPASSRIQPFTVQPSVSRAALETSEQEIVTAWESDSTLKALLAEVAPSETGAGAVVTASNVGATELRLEQLFGPLPGVAVVYGTPSVPEDGFSCTDNPWRNRQSGRLLGGDAMHTDSDPTGETRQGGCLSVGFGAYKTSNSLHGQVDEPWMITVGHIADGKLNSTVYRLANPTVTRRSKLREVGDLIGRVKINALTHGARDVDAAAVKLNGGGLTPFRRWSRTDARPLMGPAGQVARGNIVCETGATTGGVRCGKVVGFGQAKLEGFAGIHGVFKVRGLESDHGDSGAPVWIRNSKLSVGLHSSSNGGKTLRKMTALVGTEYGKKGKLHITGALGGELWGLIFESLPK